MGLHAYVDRMEDQIGLLKEVAAKLDAIHSTLKSPSMTQARELFDVGQDRFQKGLYDKAIESFLQSEQKNDVYFPLQLQIGKLFLYGTNRECDVIDLSKAETHLVLAARYANAERDTLQGWEKQLR